MGTSGTREEILAIGMSLVSEKGFSNTGISEILRGASVPKGSFYYYFESKTDFGVQLIEYAADFHLSSIKKFFRGNIPPMKRIENYLDHMILSYSGEPCSCNCIFGNLTQELAGRDTAFRDKLAAVFITWKELIRETIEEAVQAGAVSPGIEPENLAWFFLSGWEGALLQGKVRNSIEPLTEFKKIFFTLLKCS